eukprot:10968206-Alexandrium_andersonii.AAC.1
MAEVQLGDTEVAVPAPWTYRVDRRPPVRGAEGQPDGHVNVRFQERDMLEVAQSYVCAHEEVARGYGSNGCEVAVLNMASNRHPGGGVRRGTGAQVENLHRRTDAFRFLERQ